MPTHLGHEAITAKLGHADPSMYLGHEQIYPNNVSGVGVIEMEITTNDVYKDTLVWRGTAIDNLFLNELVDNSPQRILNTYNLEGKILDKPTKNQIILIEYENGIIEKRVFLE